MTLPTPCASPAPCGLPCDLHLGPERHAVLDLGHLARFVIIALSGRRGGFRQQADDLFAQLSCILRQQRPALTPTTMMVFLQDGRDEAECRAVIQKFMGPALPLTTFVVQPPCGGEALGIELWAAGGEGVRIESLSPQSLAIESDGIRWIYCGDVRPAPELAPDAHTEAISCFDQMQTRLAAAGTRFDRVVRTWIYVNDITAGPDGQQRYQELNRARTAFYQDIPFGGAIRPPRPAGSVYPASTGIGTRGSHVVMACMALVSDRPDVHVVPLENPQQTPAYAYGVEYSPKTPKFARAIAVVQGHFVTTLVSGTASIVDSRTCHVGDIVRQTEQTLENIRQLIAPENFAHHGLNGGGATLANIAKLRVYIKYPADYEACRAVCERLLPGVPAIYLHADVCRPDLLVEIEAVAFSPINPSPQLQIPPGR